MYNLINYGYNYKYKQMATDSLEHLYDAFFILSAKILRLYSVAKDDIYYVNYSYV